MSNKVIITCALTGVLTDPNHHPVPVTPNEMAREARAAFNAGASIMHVHYRQQAPGRRHLPSWEEDVAIALTDAIRESCPGVILNATTGTIGPDISGPAACLRALEISLDTQILGRLDEIFPGPGGPAPEAYAW